MSAWIEKIKALNRVLSILALLWIEKSEKDSERYSSLAENETANCVNVAMEKGGSR